ncbi:MAG TPA: hypothetical protein P5092_08270 [Ruminococcus sp.]|nr:hypothetical protein [Ruminococcus sp.]
MCKNGEKEAKEILIKKGLTFDDSYCDNNSKASMPDFMFSDGHYLEVTHTMHNNKDWTTSNKFFQKSLEERTSISEEATKAWDRLCQDNYERDENYEYTEKGNLDRNNDKAKIKSHNGVDFDAQKRTEFGCDLKGMSFSPDNVLNEILIDKGKKYPNGDVDLFIFVIDEEMNSVLNHKEYFLNKASISPFKTVYLCVWDMKNNHYEINNPKIVKVNMGDNPPSISFI